MGNFNTTISKYIAVRRVEMPDHCGQEISQPPKNGSTNEYISAFSKYLLADQSSTTLDSGIDENATERFLNLDAE